MPCYAFRCANVDCGHEFDETFSIKQELPTCCGHCEQDTLRVVLSPPVIIDRTPRTLGTLAERNSGPGRSYWLEDQRKKAADDNARGREEVRKEAEKTRFFADSPRVNTKLASLNPRQKANYILKGDSRGS